MITQSLMTHNSTDSINDTELISICLFSNPEVNTKVKVKHSLIPTSVKVQSGKQKSKYFGPNCFGSQILSAPCSSCSPPSSLLHAKIHIHFLQRKVLFALLSSFSSYPQNFTLIQGVSQGIFPKVSSLKETWSLRAR